MAKQIAALNQLRKVDRFRVVAHLLSANIAYAFDIVGPMGSRGPTFRCHIYEAPYNGSHAEYVETDTFGTDSVGPLRCHGEGRTLEDLVHNVDWPHKPSELALLKTMLAQCVTTNEGKLVGDLVDTRLSDEEFKRRKDFLVSAAEKALAEHRESLRRQAEQAFLTDEPVLRAAIEAGLAHRKNGELRLPAGIPATRH